MGVLARDRLAWRQKVPVVLAGVGVLITAARARILEEHRETERKDKSKGWKD